MEWDVLCPDISQSLGIERAVEPPWTITLF
jgi:hypothetical protein